LPLPDVLLTETFKAKWREYVAYRKTSRMKPLKPASLAKQWKELAAWGHDSAIAAIDQTIRNGWQGLFEPKTGTASSARTPPRAEGVWGLREQQKAVQAEIRQLEAEGQGYRSSDQCAPGEFPGPYWKDGYEQKVGDARRRLRALETKIASVGENAA
jgi:hypothetical protein